MSNATSKNELSLLTQTSSIQTKMWNPNQSMEEYTIFHHQISYIYTANIRSRIQKNRSIESISMLTWTAEVPSLNSLSQLYHKTSNKIIFFLNSLSCETMVSNPKRVNQIQTKPIKEPPFQTNSSTTQISDQTPEAQKSERIERTIWKKQ